MFQSLTAIIRELCLYLTKVIFMLKHSTKLRRYIYILGDVSACRRPACVLCAVRELRTRFQNARCNDKNYP